MNFDHNIIDRIKDELSRKKETIAVAESVTSGFLQAAIGSAESASDFFEGGITAYNIDQKEQHLHINRSKAEQCNCVSEDTAGEMVTGVMNLFQSNWAISVTGYATPVEESGYKTYAFYAIAYKDRILEVDRIDLQQEKGEEAQLEYVNRILNRLHGLLLAND